MRDLSIRCPSQRNDTKKLIPTQPHPFLLDLRTRLTIAHDPRDQLGSGVQNPVCRSRSPGPGHSVTRSGSVVNVGRTLNEQRASPVLIHLGHDKKDS